ncbi:unnamed protein product [Rotaria sordida]|uniref:CUB domain-containing protein n=1 Tax=Rotaria sordida TaxID=392033 RepID=A0A814MTD5_9BILA|nr:unnamed protein product [Rotaria sordida]CAF3723455.1 unnamed protein product [Rotaria sordida]
MISTYFFVFIILNLLRYSQSLQSGYTCETSVTLTCSQSQKIVILEVIYSSECPNINEKLNGTSIYAPSRCIGYYRERANTLCNGKENCIIDNSLEQRPSFFAGKQANCAFKGQSINIEYSCIPDFSSNKLPRFDICSLQSFDNITEGFIHTPNYPNNYPNNLQCSKTITIPVVSHRLKIYALDFDIESISVTRLTSITRINDWLEINNNGEKLYGIRSPFTLLFDDVIEASLMFKSDSSNTKRSYNGFLLYFIVTPVRRSRPTKVITTTNLNILSDDDSTSVIQKPAARLGIDNRRQNNTGLILLVILLSGILVIVICAVLLYKRRNDRRLRYFVETFNSFLPKQSKAVRLDSFNNSDEIKIDLKYDLSSTNGNNKSNLKYSNEIFQDSDHIYSPDPVEKKDFLETNNDNSLLYDYIDFETINQQKK